MNMRGLNLQYSIPVPGLGMDDQAGITSLGLTPGEKNGRDPALELSSDSKVRDLWASPHLAGSSPQLRAYRRHDDGARTEYRHLF